MAESQFDANEQSQKSDHGGDEYDIAVNLGITKFFVGIPLGMEFDGSWSTDSKDSDFEKMETGVNARAIDFAKFGILYLNGGNWNGTQILPKVWIDESTQPLLPENYSNYYTDYVKAMPGQGYYKYMW